MGELVNNSVSPQIGSTIYHDGWPAIFTTLGVKFNSSSGGYIVSKYEPLPEKDYNASVEWAKWGDDNLFPQNVKKDIAKAGVMKRGLKLRRDLHYGLGLITFTKDIEENKEVIKLKRFPEWETFRKLSWFDRTYLQLVGDFERYGQPFATVIFDKAGQKIAAIKRRDPLFCRWAKMDERTLKIPHLFYSKRWPRPVEGEYKKIPALDVDFPLWDLQTRALRGEIKPGSEFAVPIRLQEDGNTYYDESYWNCLRETWLPIASNVPAMKLAIMRNQMVIKYHIKIPYEYWTWKYRDNWVEWDDATRIAKIKSELDDMNEFLTNVDNAGKAFLSNFASDPVNGKPIGEWKIEAIDDKLKNDAYLPDSQAANSEILFALGIDPTLLGQASPGGSREGSGSNKREAFSIMQALLAADRMLTKFLPEFVRDFNEWDPTMEFGHKDLDTSETLDQNPTGKKTVMKA